MENLSRVFQNQKRKITHEEIEFLVQFTSCIKVIGKIPAYPTPVLKNNIKLNGIQMGYSGKFS